MRKKKYGNTWIFTILTAAPFLGWKRLIQFKSSQSTQHQSISPHYLWARPRNHVLNIQNALAGTAAMAAAICLAAAPHTPWNRAITPRSRIAERDRRGQADWAAARRRTARTARRWAPGHGTWRTSTGTRAARTRPEVAAAHATRTRAARRHLRRRRRPRMRTATEAVRAAPADGAPLAMFRGGWAWDCPCVRPTSWPPLTMTGQKTG